MHFTNELCQQFDKKLTKDKLFDDKTLVKQPDKKIRRNWLTNCTVDMRQYFQQQK